MAESGIEWCDRSDWNPIRGCTRVSEGCRNCYAEAIAARFSGPGQPFHGFAERTVNGPRWTGKVGLIEDRLTLPLRWRKPARVFVNSAFDLFHESIPDAWIDRVFAVMAMAPQHIFQVLTKRPERMRDYFAARQEGDPWAEAADEIADIVGNSDHPAVLEPKDIPLRNVWLGVSIEDQSRADARIPILLDTPAAVRWISAEPLLGPIEIGPIVRAATLAGKIAGVSGDGTKPIGWIVAGGESGPGARPCHPDWARSLRDQCAAAGVAFFFKQWGEWIDFRQFGATSWRDDTPQRLGYRGPCVGTFYGGKQHFSGPFETLHKENLILAKRGKRAAGRLLDGVTHDAFPEAAR